MALTTPWRNMGPEELEKEYSPSRWSQRFNSEAVVQNHFKIANEGSQLAKDTLDCELGVAFGPGDQQKLDIFGTKSLPNDAPIFVYIHGGYWRMLSVEESSYMASCFVRAGVITVAIGYDLCPKVTFEALIEQVRTGMAKVIQLARKRGSRGICIGGHSAGGHLTAMMMAHDWSEELGEDVNLIKGAALVSGVFDVRPLVKTSVNEHDIFTMESAWENSPAKYIPEIIKLCRKRTLRFVVGQDESPEFIRQSQEMSKILAEAGIDSKCEVIENHDHFDIVEDLRDPEYRISKIIFKILGLVSESK